MKKQKLPRKENKPLGEEEEEKDIYSEKGVEEELEDDEITAEEAGFMEGYDNKELICKNCENEFDLEKAIERDIKGKAYLFCSKHCAEIFSNKNKK